MIINDKEKFQLEKKAEDLADRIAELEGFVLDSPDKTICSKLFDNVPSYYYKEKGHNPTRHYIKREEECAFQKYARHQYASRVLPTLKKDLNALNRFIRSFSWQSELSVADKMDPALIRLCGKGFTSRSLFIEDWLSQSWEETPMYGNDPTRPTLSGARVRSKSEELISGTLSRHGIQFKYEKPLYLDGVGYAVFPDFTILDPYTLLEKYWEHFGMMDDPEYALKALRKIMLYHRNGLFIGDRLICTFETSDKPLTSSDIESVIEKLLLH